jgi:hypothetical protein
LGGRGAKSSDGEKAWHSTDHSILSGPYRTEGNSDNREDLERLWYTVKKEEDVGRLGLKNERGRKGMILVGSWGGGRGGREAISC